MHSLPQRVFAFDEFGPLTIRPHAGSGWQPKNHPNRLPANYHKLHRVRQFHGCYSVGADTMFGVIRERKSAANTLAALKSIRAQRPDGAPIYVILDNLSAHKGWKIRSWAARNEVELAANEHAYAADENTAGATQRSRPPDQPGQPLWPRH